MRELLLATRLHRNRTATKSLVGGPGGGLTTDGVEQARALAEVLAAEEISVAMTSRLARTQETLGLALDGRDVRVVIAAELDEIHFGSFDGGLLDDYRAWAAAHPPDVPAAAGKVGRRQQRGSRAGFGSFWRDPRSASSWSVTLAIRYVVDATAGLSRRRGWLPSSTRFRSISSATRWRGRQSCSRRGATCPHFASTSHARRAHLHNGAVASSSRSESRRRFDVTS